jgi:hypothetical protein
MLALRYAHSRQHPPAATKWQLTRAREIMLRGTIRTRRGEARSSLAMKRGKSVDLTGWQRHIADKL